MKYQAITHRMVHRKSSAFMYSKILERILVRISSVFGPEITNKLSCVRNNRSTRAQAITHRMVHRKLIAVTYSRILERTFGNS